MPSRFCRRDGWGGPVPRPPAAAPVATLARRDPVATRMLDTRTFYVMPILDADGGEAALTRHPAWPEHKPEEHNGKDLDGDGYITRMRVRDPEGNSYPSWIDERHMLQVRTRDGGRGNFAPTTLADPGDFERLAASENRYRVSTEGQDLAREVTDEREEPNFNRNWSAEWQRHEPGAGGQRRSAGGGSP
ncbi:MAG: M14 family zinc carboxypeptidase [Acidobacteria bacterium]|nr:M14 family zinc carboxypeptidase [Acidobacteriota bacterium]